MGGEGRLSRCQKSRIGWKLTTDVLLIRLFNDHVICMNYLC